MTCYCQLYCSCPQSHWLLHLSCGIKTRSTPPELAVESQVSESLTIYCQLFCTCFQSPRLLHLSSGMKTRSLWILPIVFCPHAWNVIRPVLVRPSNIRLSNWSTFVQLVFACSTGLRLSDPFLCPSFLPIGFRPSVWSPAHLYFDVIRTLGDARFGPHSSLILFTSPS